MINSTALTRRKPQQQRSRRTVDDVLEAVRLLAKRHGTQSITTNRVAETAGVSVGSLYQYFPDKQAIYAELHFRHVEEVRQTLEQTRAACASGSYAQFTGELVQGLMTVHAHVPELHDIAASVVPGSAVGFRDVLSDTFRDAFTFANDQGRFRPGEKERLLFVLPRLVETLVHGGANGLSRQEAQNEAIRTVTGYVNSF